MAFTRVQGGSNSFGGGTQTTLAVTISAVGSGNCICGLLTWDNGTGATLSSVTDDKGNSYNRETTVLDTTDNQNTAAFSRTNITNAPTVITATFSVGADSLVMVLDEFSGGSTTSADERDGSAHGGQFQSSPGTGTDAVTSGTFTTSTNGDLIWGGSNNSNGTGAFATEGTGFTQGTRVTGPFSITCQTEYRTQSTAGSGTAATFTEAANTPLTTFMIAVKPAGGATAAPFIPGDTSIPQTQVPPLSLRSWAWSYNQNLIAQDVFPPGRIGVLYDDPSRGYLPAGQTWTWQYNLNLVAKDVLPPGRQSFERPQPVWWYRDWTQNLLLSTLAITIQRPFNQYDWPLPRVAVQPDRSQTENLVLTTLLSRDAFPPGKSHYDLPPQVTWSRGWTQNLLLSTLAVTVQTPFNQYNWPLTQRASQPDRTQTENLVLTTLLGQDSLPPGQQRTEVPPPVSWRRDWTQSLVLSTLAGQDRLPVGVVSNRVIVAAPEQRSWTQNLLSSTLTPIIQTPLNQYDWPLPIRPATLGQTWTLNLLLSTLAPPVVLPLSQYDWPVPQRASQPNRSFASSFNLNLIAQDQLPFRQNDWPLPRGYYYPLSVKSVSGVNPNLFPPPPPPIVTGELRNPPFIGQTTGQMMTWGTW